MQVKVQIFLQQRDPLSPLLFDVVIDPIQQLLKTSTDQAVLTFNSWRKKLIRRCPSAWASMWGWPEDALGLNLFLQVIYHFTQTVQAIKKFERASLWAGTCTVSGGKCKFVGQKKLRGLRILKLDKVARAFWLRWPCHVWKDIDKLLMGLGVPCSEEDMDLFYAAVTPPQPEI
jgi:hypothetical protein